MDQASIVRRSAQFYRDNTAVSFHGKEQSYAEMFERACRIANAFRSLGAESQSRVSILSDNAFETVELIAACALGNFVRSGFYIYHAPQVNRYLLELTETTIFVVQKHYYDEIKPLLKDLPNLKAVVVFGGAPDAGDYAYEDIIANADATDVVVPFKPDDAHIIRFSSGTTGKPKGIYHSISAWERVTDEWRWLSPMITERSSYLCPIAIAHLGVALLWGFLSMGGKIVPLAKFDPVETLEAIEREKITHAVAAPVMIREMLALPQSRNMDLSSLQCLMYAGSPIAGETMRQAIEVFGNCLHQLYAQSETMAVSMLLPNDHVLNGSEEQSKRLKSVGRASPRTIVTARDDAGNILPPGEIGEIAVKGPSLMSGIWNQEEKVAERTLPDGSLLTADMGHVDDYGYIYLVDRKDDMIVSGAYNIWPTEVEEALMAHPAVAEACVYGVPHEKWGETVHATVVLKEGQSATDKELMDHSRDIVGRIKKVTEIDFIDVLPRTSNGKVERAKLKAPFWEGRETRIAGS